MRMKELHVDGFGIFNDLYIDDMSDDLILFSGNNEAGKTTLMSFIRAILYGFPRDIPSNNRHEPLNGGKHGGALTFLNNKGNEYRIERKEGNKSAGEVVVYGPSGRREGEKGLDILLQGVSNELYNNLFCFGLDELQKLETLQNDEVNNFIYSAGMGSGTRSIVEVREELLSKKHDLYTPRGRKRPEIKSLLREIDDVEANLQDLMGLPEDYNNYQHELSDLHQEVKDYKEKLKMIVEEITWLQKIEDALEPWQNIKLNEEKLVELPEINSFPEAGVTRLEELEVEIEQIKQKVRKIEKAIEKKNTEVSIIKINNNLLDNDTLITNLQEKKELYFRQLDEVKKLENDLEYVKEECQTGLLQLGTNWNEEKVYDFDFSIKFKGKIREYKDELDKIKKDVNNLKARFEAQEDRLKDQEHELKSYRQRIESITQENLNRDKIKQEELRLIELKDLKVKLETQRKVLETKIEDKAKIEDNLTRISKEIKIANEDQGNSFGWQKKTFALGLIAVGVFSLWQVNTVIGLTLIIGSISFLFLKKNEQESISIEYFNQEKDRLKKEVEQCNNEIINIKAKMNELENKTKEIISKSTLTEGELKKLEGKLEKKKKKLNKLNLLQEEYREKEKAYQRIQERYNTIESRLNKMKERQYELQSKWNNFLRKHELDQEISPDNLLDLINEAEKVRDKIRKKEAIIKKRDHLISNINEYKQKIDKLAKECSLATSGSVEYKITELANKLKENKELVQKQTELKEEIGDLELELVDKNELLKIKQNKKEVLMDKGMAKDVEEFRVNSNIYIKRRNLIDKLKENRLRVKSLVKSDKEERRLFDDLREYDKTKVKNEKKELIIRREHLEEEIANKQEKLGELRERIKNLESTEQLAKIWSKKEVLKTQLEEKAEDWAVYAICERLLEMAKEKYEEERQPTVLKRASNYFKRMTQSKYERIFKPLGKDRFEIKRYDGQRLTTDQLSKGTAEQLYLAMRLSFAREYAKQVIPLPLIMDDILVNFDSKRLKMTLKVISQVAKEQQVIFFTCHNYIVEEIEKVVKDYTHYQLEAGQIIKNLVSA
ncbi:AAA family ATPase [Selenihalanaerobacter shriftii]|uniref:Uncharacterized protein YhaN n=1 Tax=Selenihalanaerobacter shriftii TaxID=142842 RepID=A0A1T4K5U4_9FIRM|nr:AAA family ATPase [Selenihalanaerobacter shriftii]SJZ37828.1 Uncharacterized protein YhaN [Selenihalanaerobacter shriftii]